MLTSQDGPHQHALPRPGDQDDDYVDDDRVDDDHVDEDHVDDDDGPHQHALPRPGDLADDLFVWMISYIFVLQDYNVILGKLPSMKVQKCGCK